MRHVAIVAALALAACAGRQSAPTLDLEEDGEDRDETPGVDPVPPEAPTGFLAPDRKEVKGELTLTIQRHAETAEQESFILAAENAQPDRSEVIDDIAEKDLLDVPDDGPLWWFDSFDGIRIPWAVTGEAVAWYAEVMDGFMAGDFSRTHGIVMKKASLHYEAKAAYAETYAFEGSTFEDVWVVRMIMGWAQYCGPECAMAFSKERVVVLDQEGRVLAVFLDGAIDYMMS